MTDRISTGLPWLDDLLGGGLLPGTLTVALGATGIGKTQLGLAFAHAGTRQEGQPGLIFDLTARGDAQNHRDYAQRLFDWNLTQADPEQPLDSGAIWDPSLSRRDYLHLFSRSGRRVTVHDLDPGDWREWKVELSRKLDRAIGFFYANFAHGVRRCVIDGVEPADRASDSFQFHVIDYVYHQILHKDHDWVARDLFRQRFRENSPQVAAHAYDHTQIATLLLLTSHETLLDDLLSRRLETGDLLSNANTIILMGKVREGTRMTRALHVAKHRGSRCDDGIVPYEVTERGLERMRPGQSHGMRNIPPPTTDREHDIPAATGTQSSKEWRLWTRGDVLKEIHEIKPRLASWNKSTHPDQVRLRAYLEHLIAALGPLPEEPMPLFLHLSIDVEAPTRLLRHHDLENYLTPLFGRRWLDPSRFVLVSAEKNVGGGSHVLIGTVTPGTSDLPKWSHFECSAGGSPQTPAWKAKLRAALADAKPHRLVDGPAEVQLAWRCSTRRNWVVLWKPTGDAMEPVLGAERPESPFNPRDDRIVSLTLHRNDDPIIGNDICVGMWWRPGITPLP